MRFFKKNWILMICFGFLLVPLFIKVGSSQDKYSFSIGPQFGAGKEISITIKEPTHIKVTATWMQKETKLALILNGPGQVGYYERKDGYPPLTLEFEVSKDLVARGSNWKISIVNYNRGIKVNGSLDIFLSKKVVSIIKYPSVKIPTKKLVGVKKDFLEVPISKLKGKVVLNFGKEEIPKKVRVKGYYHYDRVPMLISNPQLLKIDSPLPEDSYIVLKGKIPSKENIGKMMTLSGDFQKIGKEIYLDTIDFIPIFVKPAYTYIPKKLEIPKRIFRFRARKYAVIISGGVNDAHNHSRYWNNIKYIYNVLKFDYGFSDENMYVLYYDGTGEDNTVPVDYSCTRADLQRVFNELRTKMTSFDLLFVYTTNHGGGYKQRGNAGPYVGYRDGRVVFTGNEGNEILESNFIIDGHDSDGKKLPENFGYWFDFDGDGIRDDVVANKEGTLTAYTNGDPDEDRFIENDDVDGEDTNGDFIIDSNDGGVDLNDDGDKNDWVGIDEVLYLFGEDKIYDDELRQLVQNIRCRVMITAMGQCFSGGFVNDLLGQNRVIMTSATSWEYAWATEDLGYSEFIYHLSLGLNKYTFLIPKPFSRREPGKVSILLADANNDDKISLVEAFNFALSLRTMLNTPLYEDNGVLPAQSQNVPRGGDGNLGKNVNLE